MTQTQHTPGPLSYDAESSTIRSQSTWTDTETGERHVDWTYPRIHAHMVEDWDERTLGLLFAAAPELLGRLKAEKANRNQILTLLLDGCVDLVIDKLRNGSAATDEAIAKAEGWS